MRYSPLGKKQWVDHKVDANSIISEIEKTSSTRKVDRSKTTSDSSNKAHIEKIASNTAPARQNEIKVKVPISKDNARKLMKLPRSKQRTNLKTSESGSAATELPISDNERATEPISKAKITNRNVKLRSAGLKPGGRARKKSTQQKYTVEQQTDSSSQIDSHI